MPSWNEVLKEIQEVRNVDIVRRKYLKDLYEYRKERNLIAYYSGWLQNKQRIPGVEINDDDKNAFMSCLHKMDFSKGLDLILHTPGGEVAATESLVDYLRTMFGTNIEVFIPQLAMSAGTMIACASKFIHMGKQSSIGPIDPQFNGITAGHVIEEFKRARKEIIENYKVAPLWHTIIGKYPIAFILQCENAISWSKEMVTEWLKTGMFKKEYERDSKNELTIAENIVKKLSDHSKMKAHSRHISKDQAKEIELKIKDLEDEEDDTLQDLVLTVHHSFIHTFACTSAVKIVENHDGIAVVKLSQNVPTNIH